MTFQLLPFLHFPLETSLVLGSKLIPANGSVSAAWLGISTVPGAKAVDEGMPPIATSGETLTVGWPFTFIALLLVELVPAPHPRSSVELPAKVIPVLFPFSLAKKQTLPSETTAARASAATVDVDFPNNAIKAVGWVLTKRTYIAEV